MVQWKDVEKVQRAMCRQLGARYTRADPNSLVGISADTSSAKVPINGLRHPPEGDMCGWYLWSGEEFSQAEDFFQPMHVQHLLERCPEVLRLLGLPAGYRFLIDGDYLDVWYDENLLE